MIDEDTWAINVQYAPIDTEFIKWTSKIVGARHKDAGAHSMSLNYDIAASNPPTRPLFKFKNPGGHVGDVIREIPKELFDDKLLKNAAEIQDALKLLSDQALAAMKKMKPIPTGILRDALTYGKATYTIPGHNHGKKEKVITKWQPSKYSADKRKRIRRQAVKEYLEGLGYLDIARKYGVTRETIHRWVSLSRQGLL